MLLLGAESFWKGLTPWTGPVSSHRDPFAIRKPGHPLLEAKTELLREQAKVLCRAFSSIRRNSLQAGHWPVDPFDDGRRRLGCSRFTHP